MSAPMPVGSRTWVFAALQSTQVCRTWVSLNHLVAFVDFYLKHCPSPPLLLVLLRRFPSSPMLLWPSSNNAAV